MSNMFASLARKATTLSPIIEGKEKISVGDIIEKYPDGITITNFDMVNGVDQNTGESSDYPVFTFKEDENKFGFGGHVLKKIIRVWLENFEGDIETCAKALQAAGGVKLKFSRSTTKAGRSVTVVDVIG